MATSRKRIFLFGLGGVGVGGEHVLERGVEALHNALSLGVVRGAGTFVDAEERAQFVDERRGEVGALVREVDNLSLYIISGKSREAFTHCMKPAKNLRYSITFRTIL